MKIVEPRATVVGNPWKNWVFVEVVTDDGSTGLGEAISGLSIAPVEAAVRELSRPAARDRR